MHALLNVAVMAAHRAGDTLIRNLNKLDKIKARVKKKGHNDFVSDADHSAERVIIETIHKHYPDHAIIGEEGGKGNISSRAASTASLSTPAKTVIKLEGFLAPSKLILAPGRAFLAAQPQTELTTTKVVPSF